MDALYCAFFASPPADAITGGPNHQHEVDDDQASATSNASDHTNDDDQSSIAPMMEVDAPVLAVSSQEEVEGETESTLCELASQVFPDGNFASLHTIVVGDASAGKTTIVVSLVLQELAKDPSCTDEMKAAILQVLPTGSQLTTRRPTEVRLKRQSGPCSVTLQLPAENIVCVIGSDQHDDDNNLAYLISRLNRFHGDEIFKEPLIIEITSAYVPNLQFTDLPGLKRGGNEFRICHPLTGLPIEPAMGLKDLYREMMSNRDNTVVIIDTAGPNNDVEGCQAQTVAMNIQNGSYGENCHDPEIMNRCILVLSKCDIQISSYFYKHVLPRIVPDPSSGPFQTVGLICKTEECDLEFSTASLEEISHELQRVQTGQRQYFDTINRMIEGKGQLERYGQLSSQQHYSLDALIAAMDNMLFRKMFPALVSCKHTLLGFKQVLEITMVETLAPPAEIYRADPVILREMLAEFHKKAKELILAVVSNADAILKEHGLLPRPPRAIDESGEDVIMLQKERIQLGCARQTYFEKLHAELRSKITEFLMPALHAIFDEKAADGIFTTRYSPFHRLYRFTNMVRYLRDAILLSIEKAVALVLHQLQQRFELMHQVLADMDDNDVEKFTIEYCENIEVGLVHVLMKDLELLMSHLAFNEDMLKESDEFQAQRNDLVQKYNRAHTQLDGMEHCLDAVVNRQRLANALRQCGQRLQEATLDAHDTEDLMQWEIRFWRDQMFKRGLGQSSLAYSSGSGMKRKKLQHWGSFANASAAMVIDDEDEIKTDDGTTTDAAAVRNHTSSNDDDDALSMEEDEGEGNSACNKRKRV